MQVGHQAIARVNDSVAGNVILVGDDDDDENGFGFVEQGRFSFSFHKGTS